jgi:capsular polysaccharide biosynthesis protein
VSEDIGGKYTYGEIAGMLSMSAVNQTELLEISVLCPDPYGAYKITNSIIKNSGDEIERVVDGGSVRIIDNASVPTKPSSPNVYKNTLIGALAGLILGAFVIFLMEMLDTRVKPGEDLQNKYSIPVLGEIPWIIAER